MRLERLNSVFEVDKMEKMKFLAIFHGILKNFWENRKWILKPWFIADKKPTYIHFLIWPLANVQGVFYEKNCRNVCVKESKYYLCVRDSRFMHTKYLTYTKIYFESRESVTNPATGFTFKRVFVTAFSLFPDQPIAGHPKAGTVSKLCKAFQTNKLKSGNKKCGPCVNLSQPATSKGRDFYKFNKNFLFLIIPRPLIRGVRVL